MMTESEETPAIGFCKPLAVFHRYVDPVVLTIEITASRWFSSRAVRKSWIENPGQLFNNHRPFGKGTRLQVSIDILLFNVHVVILRKAGLAIVETVWC